MKNLFKNSSFIKTCFACLMVLSVFVIFNGNFLLLKSSSSVIFKDIEENNSFFTEKDDIENDNEYFYSPADTYESLDHISLVQRAEHPHILNTNPAAFQGWYIPLII